MFDKGAALNNNCFGFVDGTVRPICRPGEHQRLVYNRHKRVHALKFQAVALGLLDICSVLWVRRIIPTVSFVFGFKSPVLA